ncbi:MAG: hypothetical protein M3Y33_19230 [Actinomycetota bacterium]|nr:hypothetical protein [Actinomycetota bacterium]
MAVGGITAGPLAERIRGVLSAEFQLVPEQSAGALIVQHPEARYFSA